ncbi:MAG: bb3-type cytochrome oxidase subunit III [Pseudomonadota bacterium]
MSAVAMPLAGAPRVGLWVFMGVVSALFGLFSIAYLMRMAMSDWHALPIVPWQLWLSTMLLGASSLAWEAARRARPAAFAAAYGLSIAFLGVQLWAWRIMTDWHFTVEANPANSFFYLITGLHGLHVLGGLAAAALVGARGGAGVALCARYWHFLLVLWLAMFGLLFGVTPEFVQLVCNTILPK